MKILYRQMENLYITGQSETYLIPTVDFNAETGVCELAGESYLEETYAFYEPVYKWLREYTKEVEKPITFNMRLTYFNTSSSRCILDMLKILKDYQNRGGEVFVNWYLDEGDEDMEEEIEDFMIDTGLGITPHRL